MLLGVDVGGTFTDAVLAFGGRVVTAKAPSTPKDQSEGVMAAVQEVRDSERGGMGHACELETSIYLAIDPDAVDMSRAVDERPPNETEHAWMDWSDGSLKCMPRWSSFSATGVHGRPTLATAEKGKALLDAAVGEIVGYVRELRTMPLPRRQEPRETP